MADRSRNVRRDETYRFMRPPTPTVRAVHRTLRKHMHLSRFARRRYTHGPTPLQPLPRLSAWLGGPTLWIKRDDQTGLAGGGNKTRKLEYLVADALAEGADTLITAGSVQSNHCRLTLAAANVEGMRCRLVLQEVVPGTYDDDASGNHFLYQLLGVEHTTLIETGVDRAAAMEQVARQVQESGGMPYIIPTGGSNPIGTLGYVRCALEMLHQAHEQDLRIDHVICPSSSGGTHAGLTMGFHGSQTGIPVTGVAVEHHDDQAAMVHQLAARVADTLQVAAPPADAVRVLEGYVGEGYSLPTEPMREAVQAFARLEGILLDPVYSGKTAAGLIDQVRQGRFGFDDNVVFLHTGGTPSLFQYRHHVL